MVGAAFRERAGLVHRTLFRDRFVCASRVRKTKRRMTLKRYLDASNMGRLCPDTEALHPAFRVRVEYR